MPQAFDAMCVGIADMAPAGGSTGRMYRYGTEFDRLPQTLLVDPGQADAALAWVRLDRGGVPALYGSARIDFSGDVSISFPSCAVGGSGAPRPSALVGPPNALLAASYGQGGAVVVAVAPGEAVVLDAKGEQLVRLPAPVPPPGTPRAVIAADLDRDCDDDIIIATDGAPPQVWLRDGLTFTPTIAIGDAPVAALAAADVDRNGAADVVVGGGNTLLLYLNDGAGRFAGPVDNFNTAGAVSAISALAVADLEGDGAPDLVVGQTNNAALAGTFVPAPAIIAPLRLEVERLAFGDADGDFDPDLVASVRGAAMRLFIARDGRLEDQSFLRLPMPVPIAHNAALGAWDAGCEPDLVIAADGGTPMLHGTASGTFGADVATPAATDSVMLDLDDDGDLDAVLATSEGAEWLAR